MMGFCILKIGRLHAIDSQHGASYPRTAIQSSLFLITKSLEEQQCRVIEKAGHHTPLKVAVAKGAFVTFAGRRVATFHSRSLSQYGSRS